MEGGVLCGCLTTDLENEGGLVLKALHLHGHLIGARVVPLRLADEEDAVRARVTNHHPLTFQRLAVLGPGHAWARLALYKGHWLSGKS